MRQSEESAQSKLQDILETIPDTDAYQAVMQIIFDPSTKINWRRANDILFENCPDLYQVFDEATVTLRQISDYMDNRGDTDHEDLLEYYNRSDPEEPLSYHSALNLVSSFCMDRYTDDSESENYAFAENIVRNVFKQHADY